MAWTSSISTVRVPQVSLDSMKVNISVKGPVHLDSNQIEQVRAFCRHVFEDVILLFHKQPTEKFDFTWDFTQPLMGN